MQISRRQLDKLLYKLSYLGAGSQGSCYVDKSNDLVYKVFHTYTEKENSMYTMGDILKFSDVVNDTYKFPKDVIMVDGIVEGYTLEYFKGHDLCQMNPFRIDLDNFENLISKVYKDIEIISDKGVCTYDVLYNIMYSKDALAIVDTLEYSKNSDVYVDNRYNFDIGINSFLVDGFFNHFVLSDTMLKEMYISKDVSSLEFLKMFRTKISEYLGHEITYLEEAKCLVRRTYPDYIRG